MGNCDETEVKRLEVFEVGPCEDSYYFGFLTGQRFSNKIKSRIATDKILQHQLVPYANTCQGQHLIEALSQNNSKTYPNHWRELLGIAQGSDTRFLDILLLNFRKEVLPFIPKAEAPHKQDNDNDNDNDNDDCSDILIVSDSMAVAAHNEDANIALLGHTYLIKGTMPDGLVFTAYTYAGELPSCAFGFNNHGLAFTLNSVPPAEHEIVAGGIGRNFISRDLLEAKSNDDALFRIRTSEVSIGHSYNLIDITTRRILNVETASRSRMSVHEVGATPFFHANMYLHLQVQQVADKNSERRQRRAGFLPKQSIGEFMSLLGDTDDETYPIYMTGPLLYTLCTTVIDLDKQTLSIIEGNPKMGDQLYIFPMA